MEKDYRYETLKHMLENGLIKSFDEIIKYVPKTTLRDDLGLHNYQVTDLVNQPEKFSIVQLCDICDYIEVHPKNVLYMIIEKYLKERYKEEKQETK